MSSRTPTTRELPADIRRLIVREFAGALAAAWRSQRENNNIAKNGNAAKRGSQAASEKVERSHDNFTGSST